MSTALQLATYEDLIALGEDRRAEVLGGEVVVSPFPLPRHSLAQQGLSRFVGGPYGDGDGRGGPGGWWILIEVDVQLAAHEIVRPDLAGWRRERLPEPWDQRPILVIPNWICEVLSPANAAQDRVRKRRLYAEHGVAHYWIVDPMARTLEAMRLGGGSWIEVGSYGDDALARIEPFVEIELEVGRLFPRR